MPNLDGIKFNRALYKQAGKKPKAQGPVVKTFVMPTSSIKSFRLPVNNLALILSLVVLFITFVSGFSLALLTPKTQAEISEEEQAESLSQNVKKPIPLAPAPENYVSQSDISNQTLFSMPLDELENVFAEHQKNLTQKMQSEILQQRAEKIGSYLADKKAPYADFSETIAKQPHWKLILAISFAESSWGKNCVDNNCSNIGVKPGHELWHKYKDYGEWIENFNKLLERRYKDWSLEKMCGVYVQPCNKNWLLATKSVFEELQQKEIY
jgi:hypothetical protein